MSNLTNEECTAGISRAAAARIQKNGKQTPMSLGEHLAARAESGILNGPERSCIVDTYDRTFDIVNMDGWRFRIRDLHRTDKGIQCVELAMDRPELERLIEVGAKMLRESPTPKSLSEKAKR